MRVPPCDVAAYTVELDAGQSGRVLTRAARTGAPTWVFPCTSTDGAAIPAVIDDAGANAIRIRLDAPAGVDPGSFASVNCEVTIELDHSRFLFSTHVLAARHSDHGMMIETDRPAHLNVVQRRRYQRRDLRDGTRVWITPLEAQSEPKLQATLLNISSGGLACRIDRTGAARCPESRPVHLEFTVADCPETFRMPAAVRGTTPAGTAGQVILALEFADEDGTATQRQRLAEVLYRHVPAAAIG